MVEKGIRGGIFHAIHRYAKTNNKYIKNYGKDKVSSYLDYWDKNNLYIWTMSQKLSVGNFKWVEETSQFNEDLIISCYEDSGEGYFLEFGIQYPKELHELHNNLPFFSETMKIKKEFFIHIKTLH